MADRYVIVQISALTTPAAATNPSFSPAKQKSRSHCELRLAQLVCARIKIVNPAAQPKTLIDRALHFNRIVASVPVASMLAASCRPPRTHRQVPHLRQNARHLHSIQLRDVRQYLCHKLIFHQFPHFFLPAALAARKQARNADFQRPRQTLQRRQRRRRLLIFNLGDVSPWHRHAQSQLALAHAVPQTQRTNRLRQVQMPASI